MSNSLIVLLFSSSLKRSRVLMNRTHVNKSHRSEAIVLFRLLLTGGSQSMLSIIIVTSMTITGVFGILANSLVIAAYLKIGFSESINISYFALGISDSGLLLTNLWGSISHSLQFLGVPFPFHTFQVPPPTMYCLTAGFEDTTSCITAYIALERCLCVLFPLQVKRIVTRRKNIVVVVLIFIFVFFPSCHGLLTHRFHWKFDPARNRTILFNIIRSDPRLLTLAHAVRVYSNKVIHFVANSAIWIFTTFLIIAMRRNEKSRKKNFGQAITESCHSRNRRVMKTVIALASLYLVFSTPKHVINSTADIYSQFGPYGIYRKSYILATIICTQLILFNSSVNVFVYLKLNSKFREVVQKMLNLKLAKN